jgi:hypothetical protein
MAYLSKTKVVFAEISLDNNNYKELSQKFTGNIIPNEWYQKFTNNRGAPDLSLISVLSEIVYWYRPKRVKDSSTGNITYVNKFLGDAWQTSYEHFERKLGFNREKIRKLFVKLEQMEICAREFRNVKLRGQTYNNRLFIHLSSEFLNSCISNKVPKLFNNQTTYTPSFFAAKEEGGSPRFRGDHIIDKENKKNIFKDRSIANESNFCKNSFEEETIIQTTAPPGSDHIQESRVVTTNPSKIVFAKAKELKDFYPLTKEDCQILQSSSKREFSLNAMNEILFDMSKRLTNRYFNSRKGFLSYMSKVFSYEMRDAVKINNDNFKIRNNQSKEQKEEKLQEEYLTKIDYSLEVSPEWHFKKRLAARLPQKTAYKLLKAFDVIDIKAGIFNLHLSKHVELPDTDRKLILQEAQATHEQLDFADERLGHIENIKIIMPGKENAIKHITQNVTEYLKTKTTTLPTGIWGRVRQSLIVTYGESIDRNWFSKLEAEEDLEKNELKLKAPNNFIRDWIHQNYFDVIENVINREQYKVSFC